MQKIEINKKILIFSIQDCDLFTTLDVNIKTLGQERRHRSHLL